MASGVYFDPGTRSGARTACMVGWIVKRGGQRQGLQPAGGPGARPHRDRPARLAHSQRNWAPQSTASPKRGCGRRCARGCGARRALVSSTPGSQSRSAVRRSGSATRPRRPAGAACRPSARIAGPCPGGVRHAARPSPCADRRAGPRSRRAGTPWSPALRW